MEYKHATLIAVAVIGILVLAACGSDSDDVPSLRTIDDAQVVKPTADAADRASDNEAAMLALTQCLRDQGIEVYDPVVDAEGNVQKLQLAEGVDPKEKEFWAAYQTCAEHLEETTFEKKRVDTSELVDQLFAVTTCLRDKGYNVDDPTAESLGQWKTSLTNAIDFDDPEEEADYEECSRDAGAEGRGK